MHARDFTRPVIALAVLAGLAAALYFSRGYWYTTTAKPAKEPHEAAKKPATSVIVSEQAQKNLGLSSKPLKPQEYWKTLSVPGMIVDVAGKSDRGIVAPAGGVVEAIRHQPGDEVKPGETLFTLRLFNDSLFQTQTRLFENALSIKLAKVDRDKLLEAPGTVQGSKLVEAENKILLLEVAAKGWRQELEMRGVPPGKLDEIAAGKFVNEITVAVPASAETSYEVQELKVDLGQHVVEGQMLCTLADHRTLSIKGRAFREETPLLERSVQESWPVEIDFQEEFTTGWPAAAQTFQIQQLSNEIDPVTRTFSFLIPLTNQSRLLNAGPRKRDFWRYRPGQAVRILVKVERFDNVFVLPKDAVAREGAEAFIFTPNDNTFIRKPVHVIYQDRTHAVIANDGSLPSGVFAVQSGADQLNRMIKSAGNGAPPGYHIHADGSLHKNGEDE